MLYEYVKEFYNKDYKRFQVFYNLTSKQVYFTALGILKDEGLDNDITQETYMAFLNTIDRYNEDSNYYAILTTISRNKSLNLLKREKNIVNSNEVIESIPNDDSDDFEVKKILSLLDNEEDRELIVYHVILEYKFKEISMITNKPLGTVLWQYNKAIKKLKEEMEKYENKRFN